MYLDASSIVVLSNGNEIMIIRHIHPNTIQEMFKQLEKIEKNTLQIWGWDFPESHKFEVKRHFKALQKVFQMIYQHVEGIQRVVQLYLFQTVTKLWSYDTYITIHSRKCENTLENPSSQGTAVPICSKLSQVAKWRFFWNIPKIL